MVLCILIGKTQQSGFAYLTLLATLAVMALVLTNASTSQSQQAKRERETQLMFIGEQFYNALASYYADSQDQTKRYPTKLEQLLIDERGIKPKHHLRQIFQDPMTKTSEWGLVLNTQKQIIGVFSLSEEVLLRTKLPEYAAIQTSKTATYKDVKFIYRPKSKDKSAATTTDPATAREIQSLLSDFGLEDEFGDDGDDGFDDAFGGDFADPFGDEDF